MNEIEELDELEIWEYLTTELNELEKHKDILGDSLYYADLQDDLF